MNQQSRSPESERPRRPWKPTHLGLIAIFLSPVPAAVLHSLNWRRLGYPERVRGQMLTNAALVSGVVFAAISEALGWWWLLAIFVAVGSYFQLSQSKFFHEAVGQGADPAGIGWPLLFSVVTALTLLVGTTAVGAYLDRRELAVIERWLETEDYDQLREEMEDWLEVDRNDPAAYWNLALMHEQLGQADSVVTHLRTYVALRPRHEEATMWLWEVEEELGRD